MKDGLLPITANDPDISNVGAYSVEDGNSYPGCDELGFPYDNENPPGDGSCGEVGCARLADIEAILLGDESQLLNPGACGAFGDGDGIAKGYVTVDLVSDCPLQTPCGQGWENPDQGPDFTGDPETSLVSTTTSSGATGSWSMAARTSPRATRWSTSRRPTPRAKSGSAHGRGLLHRPQRLGPRAAGRPGQRRFRRARPLAALHGNDLRRGELGGGVGQL